jgi:hypothetical protein
MVKNIGYLLREVGEKSSKLPGHLIAFDWNVVCRQFSTNFVPTFANGQFSCAS